ncbi:hypothetical protein GTV32_15690 [Gordonia sp. SID5947]|uniref:hypothetical protein n=1 Tax=Gordonia sp. SID5947 TaxID=2690315 RepID=UPI00136A7E8E|nr:hypothetical protein [Gordonia sp. SID5947]MYR07659.1 hypothetical protein [Gordonia sp. SID5947]
MDPTIDYLFGTGDGHTTSWTSVADADLDGDGTADAVWLDFDGDGRRDDAMWDTDGDGTADVVALDRDDDGRPDEHYRDSGVGVWGERTTDPSRGEESSESGGVVPPPRAGRVDAPAPRPGPPGSTDVSVAVRTEDLDGDGTTDIEMRGDLRAGIPVAHRLYVDDDGDGRFDHVLIDENDDGRADVSFDSRSPRFDRR